jgi:ribosomal protein L40E
MDASIVKDAFISCQVCQSKNPSEATNCFQCKADLLPGRPLRVRLLLGGIGIIGLAIPLVMWMFFNFIPGLLPSVCIIIPMVTFGFSGAFSRTLLTERLTNRANRHLAINPSQSVVDYTNALQATTHNVTRCGLFAQRGEALMTLGRLENALSDFQQCIAIPAPDRKQLSQSTAYGLWKTIQRRDTQRSIRFRKSIQILSLNL